MNMNSQALNVLKIENQSDPFDWLFSEEYSSSLGTWQQDSRLLSNGSLFNFDFDSFQFPIDFQNNHLPIFGFGEFEEMCEDLGSFDLKLLQSPTHVDNNNIPIDVNAKVMPVNVTHDTLGEYQVTNRAFYELNGGPKEFIRKQSNRTGRHKKSGMLELDEIQRYFHLPITEAAKKLRVGLTVLKKRCRELNVMRWPHRKIKSLQTLIRSVKEMGLTSEVEMLEEHQRMVEQVPEMQLTERTKKLRQACFKANYKKRRASMMPAFF